MDIQYVGDAGFQLANSSITFVAQDYLGDSGFQPLTVANFGIVVPAAASFIPIVIVTNIYA